MTIAPELLERARLMPPEAQAALAARLHRMRVAAADPTGPYGVGTRRWPSPGAMAAELDDTWVQTDLHDLLDEELVRVADGETDRLQFYCPPQEGKSQHVSRRFAEWLLSMDPTLRIVIVSFEKGRARRWGKWVRRDIVAQPELGITLVPDSRAADQWQTLAGGGIYTVGIGGSLTGEPADVMIIDDPVKDRRDAESALIRERAWEWWESVGQARLSARGRVVLIMTRWHEDDLAGRMDKAEPGRWRIVSVPAIAQANDPLGRKPGAELVSVQGRVRGYFRQLQKRLSGYVWHSIYQQTPTAAAGNMFTRTTWGYWRQHPTERKIVTGPEGNRRDHWLSDCWRFVTADLAASTRTSADWTVFTAWALLPSGELAVLDRVRARAEEAEHYGMVRPLLERWAVDAVFIERGFIGTTLVVDLATAGVPVTPLDPDADKVTRAIPAASRQKQGRILLPAGAPWLDEWINEHASFPKGTHDDQVDTTSYAVRVASTEWSPATAVQANTPQSRRREQEGLDLARAQW